MCGIAGIFNFNYNPNLSNDINTLVDSIRHRGPDGQGVWISEGGDVALGHRRLSILDLSEAGKQPMTYLNERYEIILNGEIYNFIEIKSELSKKGYIFKTESDTEVIPAAYHEWGIKAFDRFNGMWALALYDKQEKKLILSRDRFGIKPLYYHKNNDAMLFASEVKALHSLLGKKYPLDDLIIRNIVSGKGNHQGSNRTYLKDVLSLPGGYTLTVKENKISINQWYKLKKVNVPQVYKEQVIQLKDLITDSCKLRLRSDVPVGTCLSGGVDSGSISATISKINTTQDARFNKFSHRAFCASFPGSPIDESESAELLARKLGLRLDVVKILAPSRAELEEAMSYCDGPMHALAFFPIWKLYKHIKEQNISVTLDGQGPDEMLGGYNYIYDSFKAAVDLKRPLWFYDLYKTYAFQGESKYSSARKNTKIAFRQVIKYTLWRPFSKIKKYLKANKNSEGTEAELLIPVRNHLPFNNSLDNSLYQQFFQDPLPAILNQYDRCSMAHGVECRMPFMDYRIVEFIFSLPPESKVGKGYTKRILREAMKDILPDEIRLNKLKIGFNAPIIDWFKGPLKEFMLEMMNGDEFQNSKYFDGKQLLIDFKQFLIKEQPQWNEAWRFWPPVHFAWWINKNKISC